MIIYFSFWKEEEGEDADISTSTSFSSHRLPPGAHPQHYNNPRYSDMGYNGLALHPDAHEENPESILDDHVQRVMKTPGCQSPGTGRHSPKSRSPDGFPGGKVPGPGMPPPTGPGKHPARLGPKGEAASHQYHHKHVHHIHHPAGGKPKEQVEADAAMRVNGNFHWGTEQHNYGSKSRNYADGTGPSPMDPMGYRYTQKHTASSCLFELCF